MSNTINDGGPAFPLKEPPAQPANHERIPLTGSQREALLVNMMLHGKMTKHLARQILALVLDGVHPAGFDAEPAEPTTRCRYPVCIEPARQPLTERAILDLMPTTIPASMDGDLIWFARAIERAHRISGSAA